MSRGYDADVPVPLLQGHSKQPKPERRQELREPQESRRAKRATGEKEKGSVEERSELRNQSRRAQRKTERVQQRGAGGRQGPELIEGGRMSPSAAAAAPVPHSCSTARGAAGLAATAPQVTGRSEQLSFPSFNAIRLINAVFLARGFWQPI